MSATVADTGVAQQARSVPFRVSGSVATGSILQPLNSSMIAVAIVGIAAQFGSSSGITWVISALYIATAVTAPMAGKLGALLGARKVYLGGLALVALGSVAGLLAPTVGWLIFSRVLVGIGTATQYPNAMTMIRGYAERHGAQPRTAITTLAICSQAVVALGPTLGGLLVGAFGWQSIMWINLPIAAFSAVAVTKFANVGFVGGMSVSRRQLVHSLDVVGVLLFLALISSTMLFLLSLTTAPVWWLLPVWAVVLALFVQWERRADEPFIDVRALARNRALSATLARTLLTYTAFYCVFFGIPQWLQYSRGMSATEAGLTMLPVAAVGIGSTLLASRTYRRHGVRRTLTVGTCALLVGGLLLASVESSTAPIVVLLLVAAVLGIPNGFNNIGNQNLISSVTSVEEVGTAIGMYRTVQYVGANLSAVVLQTTAGHVIGDDGLHRTGWFIAVAGVLLLVGVLTSRNMGDRRAPAVPAA
ncbi:MULTISPECIES: MFS transporter [unclassified Rhodococcus (in: high G+C Gram-positive bacteria)]|uniref:MFS transporter n=1 Tax=unclassified Rhodococcus (in: high G+C Gram-positive bacteria) TaxID=192944 RepID=UPI00163B5715|nr:MULTISPECIES: MFS transporter [unclassified Rhodococcus (in: high G+C Gram-positive bacteria)]MBC2640213.1 MFS transporter [Rhodococcus sp. 3A]MBC2895041.1 MFS transporter [Rhodococcus sp. 4CII]